MAYVIIRNHRVINHTYDFYEEKYNDRNRGVKVIVNGIGARNNTQIYALGREYNPHKLDCNWYLNNAERFYTELGESVANYLERDQQQFNQRINWPNAIHANINGIGYHAIREDRY